MEDRFHLSDVPEEQTANQRARSAAKVSEAVEQSEHESSDAARSARRRKVKASVTFECDPDMKQQLIEEAAIEGVSVSELVRRRLFRTER